MSTIKILLVEDEKTLVQIVSETLRSKGFTVEPAYDGLEGLKRFFEIRPDILIADVMMPRLDGFEMVRRIRKTDDHTPVLFLTAKSTPADVVTGFERTMSSPASNSAPTTTSRNPSPSRNSSSASRP